MTLRELIAAHPDRFYPQTWYAGERFLDDPVPDVEVCRNEGPYRVTAQGPPPKEELWYSAGDLAALYVAQPALLIWRRYIWTSDLDSVGQRIYVGDNGKGFEIHRHLHLTERWGVLV